MTAFEYLSVAVSFIMALAVSVLLLSSVRAYRARRQTALDWVPFVWALSILLILYQTWFSMLGFRTVVTWTFASFSLLVLQAVTLFVAAAFVLPDAAAGYPGRLREYFEEDGRWSVAAVAIQLVVSVSVNVVVGGGPLFQSFHAFHLMLFVACLLLVGALGRAAALPNKPLLLTG